MPVLFEEISEDLNLNLVQIGTIWGIVPLGSVIFLLLGGVLCDRFGVKHTIGIACLLAGVTGATRGLSSGFGSLVAVSLLFGLISSLIPVGVMKVCRIWFTNKQLGLVTAVILMGNGIGGSIGSMMSATFLSPLLGGWRNVLFLYGAISVVLGIIWLLTLKETRGTRRTGSDTTAPVLQAVSYVLRIKAIWLIGCSLLAYEGSMLAILGYLPLYLRESGWSAISADGAVTTFILMGIIGAIPLGLLSDRLGRRKAVLIPAIFVAIICTALLPVISNTSLWVILIILGTFRGAYTSLSSAMVLETDTVGFTYSGTAIGLVLTLMRIGCFIASPLGNSLATINLGTPFVFWAILFVCAAIILIFVKETGWKVKKEKKTTYISLQ